MPSYLAVYEDSAPFLTYSGNWRAGSSGDNLAELYSESSFTLTETAGSTFSFSFYGTSVGIYGAKRGNHGLYQVTVNGQTFPSQTGQANPAEFNATLFSTSLTKGFYTVELRNSEKAFTDIDFVSWEASVGNDNEPLIVNTIQDSHPSFVYQPTDQWTDSPLFTGSFSGGGGHATSKVGSTAKLTFKGDAIAVYGPSGPLCASSYSVKLDNRTSQSFSANKQFYRARQLLYYGGNLGPGEHTITIALDAITSSNEAFSIDYAEIFTTPSLGGSFLSINDTVAPSSSNSLGLIIAVAITSALAGLAIAVLVYIFVLYKQGRIIRKGSEENDRVDPSYFGAVGIQSAGMSISPFQASQAQHASPTTTNSYYPPIGTTLPQPQYTQVNNHNTGSTSVLPQHGTAESGTQAIQHRQMLPSDMTDTTASSMMSGSTGSNPNAARMGAFPSRSIRKVRNEAGTPLVPSPVDDYVESPPPAY